MKEGVAESSVIRDKAVDEMRGQGGKKGNGMESVTKQKEEEDICDISRQMLCWPEAADSNSRVQDRNHSTKGKSGAFCDRQDKKREQTFCVRQTLDKTTQEQEQVK